MWTIVLDRPLLGGVHERGRTLQEALTHGRFHCAAGILNGQPQFEFLAERATEIVARAGDKVVTDPALQLRVTGPDAPAQEIVLLRDGQIVARSNTNVLKLPSPPPGTYRAEVRLELPYLVHKNRTVPVVYSGKLYVTEK